MKKVVSYVIFASLLAMGVLLLFSFSNENKLQSTSDTNEQKAIELLKTLSLEDKVGEMTQLALDMLLVGQPYNVKEPLTFDEAKLKKILVDLKVGSILNAAGHAYDRETWEKVISTIQEYAKKKESGIPVLYGIDAIHGVNYTSGATLFPQQLALAATWNTDLAHEMGVVSAYETRASGIPWNFSPVLDLGRDPRWPRLWETFGEDVLLSSRMGVEVIKGYQGDNAAHPHKVAATMKHFLGYSMPWSGKDRTQAWIPERQLREYFVPTFKAAIDAGALTVMINSGELNGVPTHCDPTILKDLLRDELGFKGVAVTDWEDIGYLVSRHRVAKDYKEAIKMSINSGIDMAMVPMDTRFPILLKELVEEGEVPMERIDEAVTRILALKYELGLFENTHHSFAGYDKFSSKGHHEKALRSAEESLILLKNENDILPLAENSKVLVTGPTAKSVRALNGGWSGTWQGDNPVYNNEHSSTIFAELSERLGNENVDYEKGVSFDGNNNIAAAVEAAKGKTAAIICLGELSYTEKPGDIDDLDLPQSQIDLVNAIAETGTPVIIILAEGRPRVVRDAEVNAQAVLGAFLPGDFGGKAIARVLLGDVNPSGKLPITYPRFSNSLLTYDHKGTDLVSRDFGMNGFAPQWEFGHGLSYTSFKYSNLKLNSNSIAMDGKVTITVDVENTGKREGKETVQLYISDKVASITPSVKRLRGFEKISLSPGAKKTVEFNISTKDLAFVGLDNKWVTEAGQFEVNVGGMSEVFELMDK